MRFLLETGFVTDSDLTLALDKSAAARQLEHLKTAPRILLEADANSRIGDALMACLENRKVSLRWLLEQGFRSTYRTIELANARGRVDDVQLLLDRMVDPDLNAALIALLWSRNHDVITSLINRGRIIEVVTMLLDEGCNVIVQRGKPLAEAVNYGQVEIVKLLLKRGADPGVENGNPLRAAAAVKPVWRDMSNVTKAGALLLSVQKDAERIPGLGEASTNATVAVKVEFMDLLLKAGAEVGASDGLALRLTLIGYDQDTVDRLRSRGAYRT
ncbi:hypothetical protein HDU89_004621 [Geranomyces variabilis]|nr:hypothetical protein HDU89_004621 [Geranomyces variabilis]